MLDLNDIISRSALAAQEAERAIEAARHAPREPDEAEVERIISLLPERAAEVRSSLDFTLCEWPTNNLRAAVNAAGVEARLRAAGVDASTSIHLRAADTMCLWIGARSLGTAAARIESDMWHDALRKTWRARCGEGSSMQQTASSAILLFGGAQYSVTPLGKSPEDAAKEAAEALKVPIWTLAELQRLWTERGGVGVERREPKWDGRFTVGAHDVAFSWNGKTHAVLVAEAWCVPAAQLVARAADALGVPQPKREEPKGQQHQKGGRR